MILGSQRAVYNKSGLGYKSSSTNKSFISIVTQKKKTTKAWVKKAYLINQVGQNQFYIPKNEIFYLKPKQRFYNVGGGTKIVGTSIT